MLAQTLTLIACGRLCQAARAFCHYALCIVEFSGPRYLALAASRGDAQRYGHRDAAPRQELQTVAWTRQKNGSLCYLRDARDHPGVAKRAHLRPRVCTPAQKWNNWQLRQQEPEAERGNRSARYFVNLIDGGTRQPAMKLIDHSCYSQPPGCRSAEDTSQRQRSGQVVAPYTLQAQGRNQRSECYQESGVTDGQQERRCEVPF